MSKNLNAVNWANLVAWVGMAMLQTNAIPAIIYALENGHSTPIPTILLTIGGLACYMARSLYYNDWLYTVGNGIGLVGNIILLICVW